MTKPLFMWAGGKTKLIKYYKPIMPSTIKYYYEPFFGGGAMFLDVVKNYSPEQVFINDINEDIMLIYQMIRLEHTRFMRYLDTMEAEYLPLPTGRIYRPIEQVDIPRTRYEYCDLLRHKYAGVKGFSNSWYEIEKAAVLYFLFKTGFNGVYQASQKTGKYFTPPGLLNHKNKIYDRDVVLYWHEALSSTNAGIRSVDWSELDYIDHPDVFIFLDPPYRGSFTTYNQPFNDNEQLKLLRFVQSFRHTKVLLTNRDIGDTFWIDNKKELNLNLIPVTYTAGRRKRTAEGFEAKPAIEVMLWN